MDTLASDFVPWGLVATWPARRWAEPIRGRRDGPPRGIRLGHASDSAMLLVCSFPRDQFDSEIAGADPAREVAYETSFALVNLALHQVRTPGARPDGLVAALVQFASDKADRHPEWATAQWDSHEARVVSMAGWQSGFSLGYPDVYVVVHAFGVGIDGLALAPAPDQVGGALASSPVEPGAMHWELWRGQSSARYEDLARVLVAP